MNWFTAQTLQWNIIKNVSLNQCYESMSRFITQRLQSQSISQLFWISVLNKWIDSPHKKFSETIQVNPWINVLNQWVDSSHRHFND